MPPKEQTTIAFVLPIHNESANIDTIIERIIATCEKEKLNSTIICVDDGSTDDSLKKIKAWHQKEPRVRYLSLARNFGHQTAVMAALHHVNSDYVLVMDSDGQDPPELIHPMLKLAQENFDLVVAVRKKRKESWPKRLAYVLYYRVLGLLSDVKMTMDAGDFCLYSREAVRQLRAFPEHNIFLRGLRAWTGLSRATIEYERPARLGGKPSYTFGQLLLLGLNGIIGFSYKPLRLMSVVGLIIFLFSLVGASIYFLGWLINTQFLADYTRNYPQGFTTLVILILLFGGLQMTFTGLLGEYVWRIYEEVKNRPKYFIKEKSQELISEKVKRAKTVYLNQETTKHRPR